MVRAFGVLLLWGATVFLAGAQETPQGPVLYGEGAGRLWKWAGGEKTYLSAEGLNLSVGGVGTEQLWGWSTGAGGARFFTLELPKKTSPGGKAAKETPAKADPPPSPVYDKATFPAPDRVDRVDDRYLLVYGALSGSPRYEVWKAGVKIAGRAWDDGRVVYALSLGPIEGWLMAGRTADGTPWLELSGEPVEAPEGWRGRLTVTAWVAETEPTTESKKDKKDTTPPPVHPRAAGWGAGPGEVAQPLFWGPEGWTRPAEAGSPSSGTYPLLGTPGEGALSLAGWRADEGTGTLRPWFWDGALSLVPGGVADGQPQAFSSGGKAGAFLVVRHQSAPWFTLEDGKESVALEGLGPDDRVVAVEPEAVVP